MAIKMTTGGEAPQQPPQINLDGLAQSQIGAKRSEILAEMLNKMSVGADRLPGSSLEGISRVLNAGIGAYHQNQAANQELAQRRAMIEALGGAQGVDPLEAAMFASGDRAAINTIMQGRLADRRQVEERTYQAKLLADEQARQDQIREENRKNSLSDAAITREHDIKEIDRKALHDLEEARVKKAVDTKDLSAPQYKELGASGDQISVIREIQNGYKPECSGLGGGVPALAGAQETLGATAPEWMTDENTRAASSFWQTYKRFSQLIERHKLFGAALTAAEQQAWREADVGSHKTHASNVKNFNTRMRIMKDKAYSQINTLRAMRVSDEQIAARLGISDFAELEQIFAPMEEPTTSAPKDAPTNAQSPQGVRNSTFRPALKGSPQPAPQPAPRGAPVAPPAGAAPSGAPAAPAAPPVPAELPATMPMPPDLPPVVLEGLKAGKPISPDGNKTFYLLKDGMLVRVK